MENQTVTHATINSKYKITVEQAASATKGIRGWKVEVNADKIEGMVADLSELVQMVCKHTEVIANQVTVEGKKE